jgi:hypothetical protein
MLTFKPIIYFRQLARSLYVFWVVTEYDIAIVVLFNVLNMMFFENDLLIPISIAVYALYLTAFRALRPPGYDIHWWQSIFTPTFFRAGRDSRPYPILD